MVFFFFQAEDGIRDSSTSRGLGDVYKRQMKDGVIADYDTTVAMMKYFIQKTLGRSNGKPCHGLRTKWCNCCLLYTSDAADEEDSVDLGGRRIIKKKTYLIF
ncbi:rod shape-determining protein [Lactobacillus plantarum] [Lactiplantibacillus mudanjiangensis]|nr:rod shape-determining protein [Lactobacillus plantarum] [Lactiplantibacillus mudanjiangensis]